jgi:glycosyltransferase involved in cell wall biosynthesis
MNTPARIAIIIPCYNEEPTIGDVVRGFSDELPDARICVFDNNSSDRTVEVAAAAGAEVYSERRQGKGFVVQSMFRSIDADCYVMVDGDATYPAADVHSLIAPVLNDEADMVVGSRLAHRSRDGFKPINHFGNNVILLILNTMFRSRLTDILSGYRAFNRRFVSTVPLFGGGFEIEAELTVKAIKRGLRIVEVPIELASRPEGSSSKLHLIRDGFLILNTMLALFRDYHPLTFFGSAGIVLGILAIVAGALAIWRREFDVDIRLALVVVSAALGLGSMLSVAVGLILHSIARRSQESDHQMQLLTDHIMEIRSKDSGIA